jgi:hypothetical protein
MLALVVRVETMIRPHTRLQTTAKMAVFHNLAILFLLVVVVVEVSFLREMVGRVLLAVLVGEVHRKAQQAALEIRLAHLLLGAMALLL